ncbi:MAG: HU family DNA-binding protein [Selenomonadaceae bacterium]|nr:HU family DNA-binding protein [Selenomonadaceae bacterium]
MAKKAPAKKKEKEIISKSKLVDRISAETEGITKKDIATVVNAFMGTVVDAVRNGDEVRLIGFGTFKTTHRKARTGRNPQTGEPMKIGASDSFAFRSSIRF